MQNTFLEYVRNYERFPTFESKEVYNKKETLSFANSEKTEEIKIETSTKYYNKGVEVSKKEFYNN
jgi:hypothetical protein